MKTTSRVDRLLVLLWTLCFLCSQLPHCDSQPQYHSEEELDEHLPPKNFPTKKFILKDGEASEAADMLNTTNMQAGDTELVDSPDVVDLGGRTHEEKGNTTIESPVEEICKIPLDIIKGFQDTIKNHTFPADWLRDSRNIPLINCSIVMVNNEQKLQCLIPENITTAVNSNSTFITDLPDEHMDSFNNINFSSCPQLEKIIKAEENPTFICSDKVDGNLRTTVCHIAKQWLKNKSTIAKLNCTDNENVTTGTEICTFTKEIVQKNVTSILDCDYSNNTTTCLVPLEWMKYKAFSVLNCGEQQNNTLRSCTFPNCLKVNNISTGNDCVTGNDGNKTVSSIYNDMKCTSNVNSTKMQCQIPNDWLREGNDVTKFNCTDDNTNSTQKVCTIPKEWLRENITINTEGNNETNIEDICYIPKQLLLENSSNSQLNCSSDNVTTVCHVPNEGENMTAMCLVFNQIKDEEKTLRCTTESAGNFTTFVCTESGSDIPENVTGHSHTTADASGLESVAPTSLNETENITMSTTTEVLTKEESDSRNETLNKDVESSYNQTTEQPNENSSSAVPVPQLSDVSTQTEFPEADNSSVKLNTQKETSDRVSYQETEHINNVNETGVPQTGNESNEKFSTKEALKMEDKMSSLENEVVHYEPAAAFSQLHSEHNHATMNEQTVTFLRPTESAAILVGVFIVFAVFGYAGLLIWRRMLEKRYGNRQLLINEDDDFNHANNFEMPMYELQERFWPRGVDRGSSSCDTPQKSLNKKVTC